MLVAYDTFLGASASGANQFEVMVWLGLYGGVSPLSANGYPFTPYVSLHPFVHPTITPHDWLTTASPPRQLAASPSTSRTAPTAT